LACTQKVSGSNPDSDPKWALSRFFSVLLGECLGSALKSVLTDPRQILWFSLIMISRRQIKLHLMHRRQISYIHTFYSSRRKEFYSNFMLWNLIQCIQDYQFVCRCVSVLILVAYCEIINYLPNWNSSLLMGPRPDGQCGVVSSGIPFRRFIITPNRWC